MQLQYRRTPPRCRLALSIAVVCFACSQDADMDPRVRVQRASLGVAGEGGDPDTDAGTDPDVDAGVDVCSPLAPDTSCNGVDDDCDGTADEGFVSQSTACGVGVCAAAGVTSCVQGAMEDSCTPGEPADPCNGLDDDCDGHSDEDFVPAETTCGMGTCASTGATVCAGGSLGDSCTPGTPAADDSLCNGLDDDCNGQSDENYLPQETTCGTGACMAAGMTACEAGAVQDSCTPGAPAAHDASCNASDDDCDGAHDEDFPSQSTACGVGACAAAGVTTCVAGMVVDGCTPGQPAGDDASCDGVDDDCNGTSDEGFVAHATSCGVGACAALGLTTCVAGTVVDSCTPGVPAGADASCDGVDDDCDGLSDEDYGFVCDGSAVTTCVMGSLVAAPCSDGDACDGEEGCAGGACAEGTPPDPDDGNDCTLDACLPESGVFHEPVPTGTPCDEHGICVGSECMIPRSCREWLRHAPASADGVYRIDIDGQGPEQPFDVYCDMTTAGGGWQLVTVTQTNRVLFGSGYCLSPSPEVACAGQLHPLQATPRSEILIRDLQNGAWLRYHGFSASPQSSLRRFTLELALSTSMSCADPSGHTCDNTTSDPSLTVRETSGFQLEHVTPLHQYWRAGGWWVGGNPGATGDAGRVHTSTYASTANPVSQHHGMRSRASLDVASASVGTGTQALFHRDDGCADGVQDGDEVGIDCGGSCAGCASGQDCSVHRDCESGICSEGECAGATQSCGAILAADPAAPNGRYLIDVDGPGPVDAFSVYCDMVTDGGGWQLVSSSRSDIAQVLFGDGFCTDTSPAVNCHGHIHPLQVSAGTEVMVLAPADGDYIVYDRFSGGDSSALRYFTRELALTASDSCVGTHVCGNSSRDPALRMARNSGYPVVYNPPLFQWWRSGGWWIGANPNSSSVVGRIHCSAYSGASDLRSRASPNANTVLQSAAHQLLLFRNPAPAP